MKNLILVTGGARSGKSAFAEEQAKKFGEKILYVATSIPFDDEMKLRVEKHKARRPCGWETLERYKDFDNALPAAIRGRDAAMLDCVTVMVTNIMFDCEADWDTIDALGIDKIEQRVDTEINKLLKTVEQAGVPFLAVTNEVGMGIVPENKLARAFRDIAGRINHRLAKEAESVYLCVSGIPVRIK